jgi:hypothetical protein
MNRIRHKEISENAIASVGGIFFNQEIIDRITSANKSADNNQSESAIHFDNCAFEEGNSRIQNKWNAVRQQKNRFSLMALKEFGEILHTIQDFYAHSNWVELQLGNAPLPLWDLKIQSLPQGIFSGTYAGDKPKKCAVGTPSHEKLNKDKKSSSQARKKVATGPNSGKTYFDLAFDCALKATKEEILKFLKDIFIYEISVETGTIEHAGTDADIFIILHGLNSLSSEKIYLDKHGVDNFETGHIDKFIIGISNNIDPVNKITIGYDSNEHIGKYAGWYLNKVIIINLKQNKKFAFSCNRWLAKDESDGKTIIDLFPV